MEEQNPVWKCPQTAVIGKLCLQTSFWVSFSPAQVLGKFWKDISKDFSDLRFCLLSSIPLFYFSTSYYIVAFIVDKRLDHD